MGGGRVRLRRGAVIGGVLAGLVWVCPPGRAEIDRFHTDEQADCAAKLIFMNECAGKEENLLFWSKNEDFPSLGIGHFIWYPAGRHGPFRESFPAFIDFALEAGAAAPAWILELPERRAPWPDRAAFLADRSSARVKELYDFLRTTPRLQAHYILNRFRKMFPSLLDDLDPVDRQPVREKFDLLMTRPEWVFAMIDYVNFKGEGFRSDARYGDRGWGLAQVLIEMNKPDDPAQALDEFIAAAERVLERRVNLSPRPTVEFQWLPGWKNRVRGYRDIRCR